MGLSRNKVAVSEGAAGSPPFYGENEDMENIFVVIETRQQINERNQEVVQFSGTVEKRISRKPGGVAQLGEHLPCKQGVKGSIPFISTIGEDKGNENGFGVRTGNGLIAQQVRARA